MPRLKLSPLCLHRSTLPAESPSHPLYFLKDNLEGVWGSRVLTALDTHPRDACMLGWRLPPLVGKVSCASADCVTHRDNVTYVCTCSSLGDWSFHTCCTEDTSSDNPRLWVSAGPLLEHFTCACCHSSSLEGLKCVLVTPLGEGSCIVMSLNLVCLHARS